MFILSRAHTVHIRTRNAIKLQYRSSHVALSLFSLKQITQPDPFEAIKRPPKTSPKNQKTKRVAARARAIWWLANPNLKTHTLTYPFPALRLPIEANAKNTKKAFIKRSPYSLLVAKGVPRGCAVVFAASSAGRLAGWPKD